MQIQLPPNGCRTDILFKTALRRRNDSVIDRARHEYELPESIIERGHEENDKDHDAGSAECGPQWRGTPACFVQKRILHMHT